MARLDVYSLGGGTNILHVDVQCDFLSFLETRVIVPLIRISTGSESKLPERLRPMFELNGKTYFLSTMEIAVIPTAALKNPVASLSHEHHAITDALDFLFRGF